MASNKSVDGADGVGDVVRMIVRDSDVGADLDLVLADKGWAMIRRSALWKRVGREKERERELVEERGSPAWCHTRVFRCVSTFQKRTQAKSNWL